MTVQELWKNVLSTYDDNTEIFVNYIDGDGFRVKVPLQLFHLAPGTRIVTRTDGTKVDENTLEVTL